MNILFLCHRIPFPLNKGERIRSYHMLAHLAKEHTIHLGTFVDDQAEMRHAERLRQLIRGECQLVRLGAAARMRMVTAFARGAPVSVSYFLSPTLARWVDRILRERDIDRAIVFSTAMAPYLLGRRDFDPGRVIFDMNDVDSDKWRQYALSSDFLRAWIYRREERTIFALERKAACSFGATALVSPHETETFARLVPEIRNRLISVPNGVDLNYFTPDGAYPNPFGANEIPIVMTGTMDYRPNAEGAIWFAQSILPLIRAERPKVRFYVVGAQPSANVKSLAAADVVVTGKVDDVRPYLAHAAAVVAPLRLARGIQNKVLEGMAMAKPVVATSPAVQALNVTSGNEVWIADEPSAFARTVIKALGDGAAIGASGRRYVEQNHDWARNLATFDHLLHAAPLVQTSHASEWFSSLPRAAE